MKDAMKYVAMKEKQNVAEAAQEEKEAPPGEGEERNAFSLDELASCPDDGALLPGGVGPDAVHGASFGTGAV